MAVGNFTKFFVQSYIILCSIVLHNIMSRIRFDCVYQSYSLSALIKNKIDTHSQTGFAEDGVSELG